MTENWDDGYWVYAHSGNYNSSESRPLGDCNKYVDEGEDGQGDPPSYINITSEPRIHLTCSLYGVTAPGMYVTVDHGGSEVGSYSECDADDTSENPFDHFVTLNATDSPESSSVPIRVSLPYGSAIGSPDPFPTPADSNDSQVDSDSDNDGTPDGSDAFPEDPGEQLDTDEDGVGDNADEFPDDPSEQVDSDGDGVGDNADLCNDGYYEAAFDVDLDGCIDDTDGDGATDDWDFWPDNPNRWNETHDKDGDGVDDMFDEFPDDPDEWADTDGDGTGDESDAFPEDPSEQLDTDEDGFGDNIDHFPLNENEWIDSDGDKFGDNGDSCPDDPDEHRDRDGDGWCDGKDAFPDDSNEWLDTDGDGVGDESDADPNDPDVSEHSVVIVEEDEFIITVVGIEIDWRTFAIAALSIVILVLARLYFRKQGKLDDAAIIGITIQNACL